MFFKQFYLGCLAHASYLIGSTGWAAVVDPRRDVEIYLEEAEAEGLTIGHVLLTHLHADFVAGHTELARRTGAKIYISAQAGAKFPHVPLRDGDEIRFGSVILRALETPGHTPESLCYLVFDTEGSLQPQAVLTGDTLFIGDVGRPDLLGARISAQELAGMLYSSLHEKLLTLSDEVKVYPAHGAGSLCGRNISQERSSTIGRERQFNYACQPMSRERFIELVTVDLPEAPAFFSRDAQINREGALGLDELLPLEALTPDKVRELDQNGHVILDTRAAAAFGAGHVPGSINIGLGGQFATWAGIVIGLDTPVVLVAEDEERVAESRMRLARVGMEKVVGYLGDGIGSWDRAGLPLGRLPQIAVDELRARLSETTDLQVLDVRRPNEWQSGHIAGARHLPLHELDRRSSECDFSRPTAITCAGGYRSSIAASLLLRQGASNLLNIVGGMTAWQNAGYPVAT